VEIYGTARQATDDNIMRGMRFTCWITKVTDTHSKYVILIAFSRKQWLRERASMLHYTYITDLVRFKFQKLSNVNCRIASASWEDCNGYDVETSETLLTKNYKHQLVSLF
jgi:hypothetical protein